MSNRVLFCAPINTACMHIHQALFETKKKKNMTVEGRREPNILKTHLHEFEGEIMVHSEWNCNPKRMRRVTVDLSFGKEKNLCPRNKEEKTLTSFLSTTSNKRKHELRALHLLLGFLPVFLYHLFSNLGLDNKCSQLIHLILRI